MTTARTGLMMSGGPDGDGNASLSSNQYGPKSHHRIPDYRPSALRLPFLTGLFVTVLSLTAAMVYALCTLPVNRTELDFVSKRDVPPVLPIKARQSASIPIDNSTTSMSVSISYDNTITLYPHPTGTTGTSTGTMATSKYGDIGSNTITIPPTQTPFPGDFPPIGSNTITIIPEPTTRPTETAPAETPFPDDYPQDGSNTITYTGDQSPTPPTYPPTSNYEDGVDGTVTVTEGSSTATYTYSLPTYPTGVYPTGSPANYPGVGDNTVTYHPEPTGQPTQTAPSSDYPDLGGNTVTGPVLAEPGPSTTGDSTTALYVTSDPTVVLQGEWKMIGTDTETEPLSTTGIDDKLNPIASPGDNNNNHDSNMQLQTTLTDSLGSPTATVMVTSPPSETTAVPLTNEAIFTTTLQNSQGDPIATLAFFPSPTGQDGGDPSAPQPTNGDNSNFDNNSTTAKPLTKVYYISRGEYLIGAFLPTLLATILVSIPIRLIDANARAMRPWRQLASASSSSDGTKKGVPAEHSLLMSTRPGMTTVSGFYALADAVGWGSFAVGTWMLRYIWTLISPRSWSSSSSTSSIRGQHEPLANSSHISEDGSEDGNGVKDQNHLPLSTIVDPLSALTSSLYLAASLLIPFSGEAVNLDLRGVGKGGSCGGEGSGDAHGCAIVLSAFERAAIPTLVLLSFIAVGLLVLLGVTAATFARDRADTKQNGEGESRGSWMRTGVATNPWSVCGVAALSLNPRVRQLFAEARRRDMDDGDATVGNEERSLKRCLRGKRFGLGHFHTETGKMEYGVVLYGDDGDKCSDKIGIVLDGEHHYEHAGRDESMIQTADGKYGGGKAAVQTGGPEGYYAVRSNEVAQLSHSSRRVRTLPRATARTRKVPFLMLGYPGRIGLLIVVLGILTILVYYWGFSSGETPFENFMNTETVGVRFLFTLAGVIISYLWESFSTCLALLTPYRNLHHEPQPARTSILLAPPTNAYSGIWSLVFRQRHRGANRSKNTPTNTTPNSKDAWRNTNTFPALAAFLSICAEILLPISLSLVPYSVTTTWPAFKFGIFTSMLLLSSMAAMVMWSLVAWPCYHSSWSRINLPVNPVTIAGAMWYVLHDDGGRERDGGMERPSRSRLLARLEAEGPLVATLGPEERDARVKAWEALYRYGEIGGGGDGHYNTTEYTGRGADGSGSRDRIGIDITEESKPI